MLVVSRVLVASLRKSDSSKKRSSSGGDKETTIR